MRDLKYAQEERIRLKYSTSPLENARSDRPVIPPTGCPLESSEEKSSSGVSRRPMDSCLSGVARRIELGARSAGHRSKASKCERWEWW